ncbi:hypothetical protein BCLUESOX_2641 [bacterium endosymbiont of Bathymodiolus sp. 5 South]|nr:hypothetical protein [uncultured Gammaproteobacteria bacterium]SHN92603.1 hypothetical protein BCLUESOX_2641 [bacterium endosymbiont of Bathymodiolus sp. 5 South]
MKVKNKHVICSRISEAKFRQIILLFSEDLSATQISHLTKLSRQTINRDLCINMNNHQNAIFHQLDNFMKHSHSFAMTIFHKITKSEKLVILLIIPTYAKVSNKYLSAIRLRILELSQLQSGAD